MSEYVHRCRFIEWDPNAVRALAFHDSGHALAVARGNGSIEVWDIRDKWNQALVIPGEENTTWTSLAWYGDRLFSSGLTDHIIEWNLATLQPEHLCTSYGGAVDAIAINSEGVLAAACEDGCVRLFTVSPEQGFQLVRSCDKQDGRILCLSWGLSNDVIFTGGSDATIVKWNATTGRADTVVTVETFGGTSTSVWSLAVIDDNTIVTGSSIGNTQFWDMTYGTMLSGFHQHQSDVLEVVVSADRKHCFSSGIDNAVVQFRRVDESIDMGDGSITTQYKWVKASSTRSHSHDVWALACSPSSVRIPILVSAGVDGLLISYAIDSYSTKRPYRHLPFPSHGPLSLAKGKQWLLARDDHALSVWKLAQVQAPEQGPSPKKSRRTPAKPNPPPSSDSIPPPAPRTLPQTHLLKMEIQGDRNILTSAISANGSYIACSTVDETKVWKVSPHPDGLTDSLRVSALPEVGEALGAGHRLVFSSDNGKLIAATLATDDKDSQVVVYDLNEMAVVKTFVHDRGTDMPPALRHAMPLSCATVITQLVVSSDSQWLAAADIGNRIHIYNLDTLQHHVTLPVFESPCTSLAFHPHSATLVVTTIANSFYLFNVEMKRLTDWSREYVSLLPHELLRQRHSLRGVSFNPAKPGSLYLYATSYVCHVDLSKPVDKTQAEVVKTRKAHYNDNSTSSKKRKRNSKKLQDSASTVGGKLATNFALLRHYQQIIFLDHMSANVMVVAERPWIKVLQSLPDAFYRHKYGT